MYRPDPSLPPLPAIESHHITAAMKRPINPVKRPRAAGATRSWPSEKTVWFEVGNGFAAPEGASGPAVPWAEAAVPLEGGTTE